MKYSSVLVFLLAVTMGNTCPADASGPIQEVSFETAGGGRIFANLTGRGDHAVVPAHGAVFSKESWTPLMERLAGEGYRVPAIDFRGYGKSTHGTGKDALYEDLLAAIRYLRDQGARRISVIGGSMGGGAAAEVAVRSKPGDIDALGLLSAMPIDGPGKIRADRVLFVASEEEGAVSMIKEQYRRAPEPKRLEFLRGSAHARHIFKTDQAEALTGLILQFLAEDLFPSSLSK